MRKLLRITATFALALVFTAGVAFGQSNDAEVEQQGQNNDGTVNQTGTNEATLLQGTFSTFDPALNPILGTSRNNTATIDQDGDFTALLGQGVNGGTATKAKASLTQSGVGGFADIFQGFRGNGVARRADAMLTQGASGNVGFIRQGQGGTSRSDEATLTQSGSGNFGAAEQGFGSNYLSEKKQRYGHSEW